MNRRQFQVQCDLLGLTDYEDDDCGKSLVEDEQVLLFIWSPFAPNHITMRTSYSWGEGDYDFSEQEFLELSKDRVKTITELAFKIEDSINYYKQQIEDSSDYFDSYVNKRKWQ